VIFDNFRSLAALLSFYENMVKIGHFNYFRYDDNRLVGNTVESFEVLM
jgi:hypothetical protein